MKPEFDQKFDLNDCGCHKTCLVCGWSIPHNSYHDPEDCQKEADEDAL